MRASRIAVGIGCILLAVSTVLYITLEREVVAEQALSPAVDSFGVAVLGMMYGPPVLTTAAAGVLSICLGICLWAFAHLRSDASS
jgi:hypothetical protein